MALTKTTQSTTTGETPIDKEFCLQQAADCLLGVSSSDPTSRAFQAGAPTDSARAWMELADRIV